MSIDRDNLSRVFELLNFEDAPGVSWSAKSPTGHAIVGSRSDTEEHFINKADKQDGWDFYVLLNPTQAIKSKPSKADITHLRVLGIDVDPLPNTKIDKQTVANVLSQTIMTMTGASNNHCIIDSGRGIWAWLFIEPQLLASDEARELADQTIKGFTEAVATQSIALQQLGRIDSASAELSRIARCPGTINSRSCSMAEIVIDHYPIDPIKFDTLRAIAGPHISTILRSAPPPAISGGSLFDIVPHLNITSRQFVLLGVDSSVESRHRRLYSTARNLMEVGVRQDLAEFILWSGAERCIPNLNRTDPGVVARTAKEVWKNARIPVAPPASKGP